MQVSNRGLQLTESSEGCSLKAYPDTGGVWTIGYGHTKGVKAGQVITQSVAETLLNADIQSAVLVVNSHCLPCTQGQFDALVDFVFNVGAVQFLSSHLFTYHKTGQYDKAADEFPKWKYDNGKVEPGLVTRRAKERELYTLQEPEVVHLHTDVPEHSVVSASDPGLVASVEASAPPLQVQPVQVSDTVPASSKPPSVSVSPVSELFRSLIEGLGKLVKPR